MRTVYLAGPIRHSDDYGKSWRREVKERFEDINWNDPLNRTNYTNKKILQYMDAIDIVEEDLSLIDESDAVLVNWEEEVPTAGTPMEVRYAYTQEIPVVLKSSLSSISPWMVYHADSITDSFEMAVKHIKKP